MVKQAGENPQITQSDLDALLNQVMQGVDGFVGQVKTRISELEERLEKTEKISAAQMLAAGEAAVLVEALYTSLLEILDEDQREALEENIQALRDAMLKALNDPGLANRDSEAFTAMADVDD